MRRLAASAALVGSVGLLLAGCSAETTAADSEWLMAVAGGASVERRGSDVYLLLDDPTDALLFTDRPDHRRVDIGPEAVVGLWSLLGFSREAPNAAVSVSSGTPAFVTLADPSWSDNGSIRWRIIGGDMPEEGPAAILIDDGAVDTQITDSVVQSNVKVLGDDPAEVMGQLYQDMAANIGLSPDAGQASQESLSQLGGDLTSQSVLLLDQSGGQGVPGASTPTD